MADEMTPGEIARTFDRVEAGQRATNDRLADLAKSMVPTELWAAEHRALKEDVSHLEHDTLTGFARAEASVARLEESMKSEFATVRGEIKTLREERAKRSVNTWQITVSIVAALAAVALVIEGVLQAGGH